MEAATVRIRMKTSPYRDIDRRTGRGRFRLRNTNTLTSILSLRGRRTRQCPVRESVTVNIARKRITAPSRTLCASIVCAIGSLSILPVLRADIPWPEVVQRLRQENEKLANRPSGHNGEYFVVCTLYYTPMESGFTAARGFDATPATKPGLHGRTYPRDFLRSV